MSTNLVINDESSTRTRSAISESKTNRTWIQFLPLVVLILVALGGMVVLCYKCEHPTKVSIFQGR